MTSASEAATTPLTATEACDFATSAASPDSPAAAWLGSGAPTAPPVASLPILVTLALRRWCDGIVVLRTALLRGVPRRGLALPQQHRKASLGHVVRLPLESSSPSSRQSVRPAA